METPFLENIQRLLRNIQRHVFHRHVLQRHVDEGDTVSMYYFLKPRCSWMYSVHRLMRIPGSHACAATCEDWFLYISNQFLFFFTFFLPRLSKSCDFNDRRDSNGKKKTSKGLFCYKPKYPFYYSFYEHTNFSSWGPTNFIFF